ncbi:MAG TPA: helix-turn-helix domain-containing protein [Candidatus Paceibacterota bacterium]
MEKEIEQHQYGKNNPAPSVNDRCFDVLGLTQMERKIIIATWNNPRSTTAIARDLKVSRGNVHYALKRLCERGLLRRIKKRDLGMDSDKDAERGGYWKSDIIRAVRSLQAFRGGRLS